jgi:micrococcal nuclease
MRGGSPTSRGRRRWLAAACFLAAAAGSAAAGTFHVVDGDTFDVVSDGGGKERIRIENMDAPELYSPHCLEERDLAIVSSARLLKLLAGGAVSLDRHGKDQYGRTLAIVTVDGEDAAAKMIAEGFARPWRGHRESWCR